MASVGIYLNFMGEAESAFNLYRSVFGGEFASLQRMSEVPADPAAPALTDRERDMIMHVELQIMGGTSLFGTDMLESMGHALRQGNNITISLNFDDLGEATRVFSALSDGGSDVMALTHMFWGAHWGTCADRFGIRWMFNCPDAVV